MPKKSFPLPKVYGLLEPGPVVMDRKMVEKYNFFILEVLKAWIDPLRKNPQNNSSYGKRRFHGCRRDDQTAFKNEIGHWNIHHPNSADMLVF